MTLTTEAAETPSPSKAQNAVAAFIAVFTEEVLCASIYKRKETTDNAASAR